MEKDVIAELIEGNTSGGFNDAQRAAVARVLEANDSREPCDCVSESAMLRVLREHFGYARQRHGFASDVKRAFGRKWAK